MRASFLTAALLTLGGASTVAHAVPGSHEHAASERERGSTCTTEHGAPKALEVSTSASAAERGPVELGRLLDELNAATEAARQDAEEKRAEAERAAAVLRALETDLARVEALLVESMAEARGAEEQPALQGIGYADDETSGAVRLRLVDLSDSGAPALVPVDVREPAPAAEDRGFMGVTVRDGDDGVTVSSVVDGSPAEAAGLQAEDVLFNIGGASVVDMDGLIEAMSAYAAGDTVVVGIMRGKKPMRRRVTLGSQGATRVAAPSTGAPTEGAPLDLREVSEEIVLKVEMEDPRRDGARRLRLIRSDADGGAIIAIAGELDGEIIAQEIEIEFADGDEDCCGECDGHEDGDCCGECEDHEHEDCCGECDDHEDDDCCGECGGHEHEDCCGECGHDALPEGYEEIFERRETRSVHDGNEEAEVFVRRERRPAWGGHGEGHDHRDGVGPEIEELHLRIERLQRELEELTEALLDVRREMDRRGRR
ncbi:MAG: PDZ domain-containing protein [Planctomycetota bacterium]|nr:PDZ domain-containing protein [Planctomycetota bacterium]